MGKSKIAQALESHPHKRTVTIGGQEFDFLLGGLGMQRAHAKKLDIPDDDEFLSGATVIYAGLLTFDPDFDFELFLALLSFEDVKRLTDELGLNEGEKGEESAGN